MKSRFYAVKNHAYGRIALLFIACLIPFTVARVLLYSVYHSDFAQLDLLEVIAAFLVGLRFDASIVSMAVGFPLLLMLAPFKINHRPYINGTWGWIVYIMLLTLILMIAADMFYFDAVRRHAGPEVRALTADIGSVIYMATHDFPWALTLFVIMAIMGIYAWRRLLYPIPAPPPTRLWLRAFNMIALLALFVFIGRGGLQYKPLAVSDAFFSNSSAAGYLVLNGPFSLAHAMEEQTPVVKDFMPSIDAARITQEWLRGKQDHFNDAQLPLLRSVEGVPHQTPLSVVVFLLESWDATNVDAMRIAMGKPARGATPNFDSLARAGRLYTNFYAVGQRSIEGIAGILAGMPTTPGMPPLGVGMEQNRLSFLGQLAKSQGYRTIFLQSSKRGSFYVDAIAKRAGFDTYRGAEDFPELHPDKLRNAGWGAWDHNTLQTAHTLFQASQQPFAGFIFTSSTHTPYATPTDQWKKFRGHTELDEFLNTLYYADWALGEFIAATKKAGYFANTLFILTGDHVSHFVDDGEQLPNRYRVPLLIVGPGVTPGIDTRVGGHLDILPTIIDAAGWNTRYAALGSSLLDDTRATSRAVFCVRATLLDWIASDGWITHDLDHRLNTSENLTPARAAHMELQLTAAFQIVSHALVENRVAK
ncbi:MAG: sulfatase-like hydrolase/transferase [Pseudomonadota bacterium]